MPSSPWRPPGLSQLAALQIDLDVDGGTLKETRERWTPCHRVIASEYASENLFDRLTGHLTYTDQEADNLREVADLTNPYVLGERGRIELVLPQDHVHGSGAGLIVPAFTFPTVASRFSDGSAGTYYAARSLDSAVAETCYHATAYLRGSGPCVVDKTAVEANLDGVFLDMRHGRPAPPGIYDPADYRAAQALGAMVRQLLGFGIVYDSVRGPGGECVAVMRPPVLQHAAAVQTLQYMWDGNQITDVR